MDALSKASVYITYLNSLGLVGLVFYYQKQINKLREDIKAESDKVTKIIQEYPQLITRLDNRLTEYTTRHEEIHRTLLKQHKKDLARISTLEAKVDEIISAMGDKIPASLPQPKKKKPEPDEDSDDTDDEDAQIARLTKLVESRRH